MRRLANRAERRRQRREVGRRAEEFDHRREVVLSRDLSRLADAVRGCCEILGGDSPVRGRRGVDLLQSKTGKLLAAPSPRLQGCFPRRTGDPEIRQDRGGAHRREPQIVHKASCAGQRIVPEEPVEHAVVQLDVLDSGSRPTLERSAEAGRSGGILVNTEQHLTRGSGLGVQRRCQRRLHRRRQRRGLQPRQRRRQRSQNEGSSSQHQPTVSSIAGRRHRVAATVRSTTPRPA